MARYVVVDDCGTELFNEEFYDLNEAIKAGNNAFWYLSDSDKKRRSAFYLLESADPDEESERHYDGNVVKEWL